jgi:hypothetical protein
MIVVVGSWANVADFPGHPNTNPDHLIHVDLMILSEPSIIFIWTYQDMMEWMSRILVGEIADLDHD